MENMLAAMAQFDNDQKSERTKAGMITALEMGRWTWAAPVGYLNSDTRSGQLSLVRDSERHPWSSGHLSWLPPEATRSMKHFERSRLYG